MRSIMSVWSCALIACFSSYLQEAEAQRAPVGVSVSPAHQEVSSVACFCYKEKIKGADRPVTACRSTPKRCERLRDKVQRGTKLLLKNSASTPCTSVLMSKHPSEVLGDHAGWAPPRKPGSFFYPQGCALKAPPSKLSQVIFTDQLDTIDNTLFSPQSPLIKAIEAREGALTPLEQLSAVWPKELSAEWTLMSFTSSVQTSLKGLRYEGCGASACDMTLVFNKELKETLVRYPTASFQTPPTLIKPQALALQVSARPTAQKDPKAHQITGAHYQALLNNINALAIRDRLPGERFALAAKKTFCSAKTISIYSIKTTPYLPYLLHCSVPNKQSEIEEADHKAWRALQTHEQLPETLKGEWGQEGYLFHGLFLFDGQSTVRPIEFYWGSEERTFVEPPELGIDINGDGVYQVIYHQGYYEGNASTLFDAERGWLRFTTLYANGA